jgi:hypothetical protein
MCSIIPDQRLPKEKEENRRKEVRENKTRKRATSDIARDSKLKLARVYTNDDV